MFYNLKQSFGFSLTKRIIGFVSGFGALLVDPVSTIQADANPPNGSDQIRPKSLGSPTPRISLSLQLIHGFAHHRYPRNEKSKCNRCGTHSICTDIHDEITLRLIKFMNMYGARNHIIGLEMLHV